MSVIAMGAGPFAGAFVPGMAVRHRGVKACPEAVAQRETSRDTGMVRRHDCHMLRLQHHALPA